MNPLWSSFGIFIEMQWVIEKTLSSTYIRVATPIKKDEVITRLENAIPYPFIIPKVKPHHIA